VPTLDTVVARLASVPNRRKTIILVTTGIPISFAVSRGCPGELSDIMKGVYRRAQQANVNIYSIDPAGQNGYAQYLQNPVRRGGRPADRTYSLPEAERAARTRREFMEITADHTGARAITNTNDLSHEIDQMLTEAASYYLVGYQTSNGQPDGKFRRLDVKVNRPDVTVRTRSGFYAPSEDEARPRPCARRCSRSGPARQPRRKRTWRSCSACARRGCASTVRTR
jgi:VWFA-related protein